MAEFLRTLGEAGPFIQGSILVLLVVSVVAWIRMGWIAGRLRRSRVVSRGFLRHYENAVTWAEVDSRLPEFAGSPFAELFQAAYRETMAAVNRPGDATQWSPAFAGGTLIRPVPHPSGVAGILELVRQRELATAGRSLIPLAGAVLAMALTGTGSAAILLGVAILETAGRTVEPSQIAAVASAAFFLAASGMLSALVTGVILAALWNRAGRLSGEMARFAVELALAREAVRHSDAPR